MIEGWQRFKVTGPYPSGEGEGITYRVKDVMSGDYLSMPGGEIIRYDALSDAREAAQSLSAQHEQRAGELFGPERRERVSFA